MERVGIIGLGLLGSAVAERLAGRGFDVIGFDIVPGRGTAASAREVFEAARRVALALPDSTVSVSVLDRVRPIAPETIVIDMTTGEPEQMANLGKHLATDGVQYIDACVGGSSEQVRRSDAIVIAGGAEVAFEQCRDLFDAFARAVFHVGPCGAGARMKLAMNLVLGLNRAALAEGLAFARAFGLDPANALDVFRAGPAYSKAMDVKGPRMLAGNFAPEARLSQHRKDVDLILAAAQRHNARVPLSAVHRELLGEIEAAGYGAEDNSAIIRAFEPR